MVEMSRVSWFYDVPEYHVLDFVVTMDFDFLLLTRETQSVNIFLCKDSSLNSVSLLCIYGCKSEVIDEDPK